VVTATMQTNTRLFFLCPKCGKDDGFEVTHYLEAKEDRTFGAWYCRRCGAAVRGTWRHESRTVELRDGDHHRLPAIHGLMLLKLTNADPGCPIYFVVEQTILPDHHSKEADPIAAAIAGLTYYVNEHTCPTNLIRVTAIIEDGDDDHHGVVKFVAWAPKPEDWDKEPHGRQPGYPWEAIFPILGR
jgi:hypothetical protein